ncbi:MAG: hypothetical protein ACOZBW_12965 [Thermodesulfobacteriota bacterium]
MSDANKNRNGLLTVTMSGESHKPHILSLKHIHQLMARTSKSGKSQERLDPFSCIDCKYKNIKGVPHFHFPFGGIAAEMGGGDFGDGFVDGAKMAAIGQVCNDWNEIFGGEAAAFLNKLKWDLRRLVEKPVEETIYKTDRAIEVTSKVVFNNRDRLVGVGKVTVGTGMTCVGCHTGRPGLVRIGGATATVGIYQVITNEPMKIPPVK